MTKLEMEWNFYILVWVEPLIKLSSFRVGQAFCIATVSFQGMICHIIEYVHFPISQTFLYLFKVQNVLRKGLIFVEINFLVNRKENACQFFQTY